MNLLKKLSRRMQLVVILVGCAFAVVLWFYFIYTSPAQEGLITATDNTVAQVNPEPASSSWPLRLKIPVINVDAAIEQVGLTPDGAMDVPTVPLTVGWFNLGQQPGEIGSAVIDGHYGLKAGKASVFDNLYQLRKGDKIYVENNIGGTSTFVVIGSRRYEPDADATGVFSSTDGLAHLNLITCEGTWDKAVKSYSKRLVVFTDKE